MRRQLEYVWVETNLSRSDDQKPSELEDGGPCASAKTTLLNDFLQEFRTGF